MREEGTGWDSQFWSGISRGIWLVGTGCSMAWGQGTQSEAAGLPGLMMHTHGPPEAEEGSEEGEGERDAEPEAEQGQQRGEGDGGAGASSPQEQVQSEEHDKRDPGEGERGGSLACPAGQAD